MPFLSFETARNRDRMNRFITDHSMQSNRLSSSSSFGESNTIGGSSSTRRRPRSFSSRSSINHRVSSAPILGDITDIRRSWREDSESSYLTIYDDIRDRDHRERLRHAWDQIQEEYRNELKTEQQDMADQHERRLSFSYRRPKSPRRAISGIDQHDIADDLDSEHSMTSIPTSLSHSSIYDKSESEQRFSLFPNGRRRTFQMSQTITSSDEKLIKSYLFTEYPSRTPPLHVRRTLDQFCYYTLPDTTDRDEDQVVYRGSLKLAVCYPTKYSDRYSIHKMEGVDDSAARVFMVDELWLWIIDKGKFSPLVQASKI